jgi:hypothetical protein
MEAVITIPAFGPIATVEAKARDGYSWVTVNADGVWINIHVRREANLDEIASHLRTALELAKEPA